MYLTSWSGGKDSCLALYYAILEGLEVSHLVNFISERYKRVSFHGTEAWLIQLQAQALGIELVQKETSGYDYEQVFKKTVSELLPQGIKGMVFGDIYLEEHKQWVERVCSELGITALEPLWSRPPREVYLDFLEKGFEAILMSGDAELFGEEWLGRKLDLKFLSYLEGKGIDPCGENGEYHTLVVGGPIFSRRIKILKARPILREKRWYLDTINYSL